MTIKTSVEIVKSLDKIDKDRKYFHESNSDVLCELISLGTITAMEYNLEGLVDISNRFESIIVDDGLTRIRLAVNSKIVDVSKLKSGDIVKIDVDEDRYSVESGYLIIVDGEITNNGLAKLIKV